MFVVHGNRVVHIFEFDLKFVVHIFQIMDLIFGNLKFITVYLDFIGVFIQTTVIVV